MADEKVIISIEAEDGQVVKVLGSIKREAKESVKPLEQGVSGGFSDALKEVTKQVPALKAVQDVFTAIPGPVKAAALAAVALKEALDITIEGEKLQAISNQFEILSRNAGIAGLALKAEFVDRAQGLVQIDDLTQVLNKSIIELGSSAERLGPVFDTALKATQLFGGSATQNFELLNQAIATGNARSLRQLGLIIDTEKVFNDYAKTLGVTADRLSLTGKQQALLNAVIDKGNIAFAGIDPNSQQATSALTRFKNAVKDLTDGLTILSSQVLGGPLEKLLNKTANAVSYVANTITSNFGKGMDQTIAQQELLKSQIASTENRINQLRESSRLGLLANQEPFIRSAVNELKMLKQELAEVTAKIDQSKSVAGGGSAPSKNDQIQQMTMQQEQERRATLLNERNKTQEQILANDMKFANDSIVQQAILSEQLALTEQQKRADAVALDLQYKQADLFGTEEHEQAKLLLETSYAQKRAELKTAALEKEKQKTLEINNVLNRSLQQGISSSIQQMTKDLMKGEFSFDKFGKAIIGIIGDMAISMGTYAIAQGVVMQALASNPFTAGGAAIVAGIALIAIGTALKSFSGEGGGGGTTTIGSAPAGPGSTSPEPFQQQEQERITPQTAVTVNIQGDVLDSRETGLRIAEIINENFDLNGTRIVTGVT